MAPSDNEWGDDAPRIRRRFIDNRPAFVLEVS